MSTLSQTTRFFNPTHPTATHARRRLLLVERLAHRLTPTVTTWAILHHQWRELEQATANAPELAAQWRRVDRALGGRRVQS